MYPNLKLQIFKSGIHQNHLARELGWTDTVLSKIIHGYRQPTEQERKMLAAYLRVDENWLFEKFDVAALASSEVASEGRLGGKER
jgi:transcriptional regulator with XRE-family HTH domain